MRSAADVVVPRFELGLERRSLWMRFTALLAACAAVVWLATSLMTGSVASRRALPTQAATRSLPASLAAAASPVIGTREPRFRVTERSGWLFASGGGLTSSFTRAGVSVTSASGTARLSLLGVGYGSQLAKLPAATPTASGSSVSYRRGSLLEWYRNGPFGLEQGFTLARRPARSQIGPLTLMLGVGRSLDVRRSSSGIVFASANGHAVLDYGALSVHDASGRSLPAAMLPSPRGLVLRVWDRGARYPLSIDPLIEQAKLTALTSGGDAEAGNGQFGYSVALSANGEVALVGTPYDHGLVGSATVFVHKGSVWVNQHTLYGLTSGAEAEVGDGQFGYSVALSANGEEALVGTPYDHTGARSLEEGGTGSATVFVLKDNVWVNQHTFYALTSGGDAEAGNGLFGASVALSSNGHTVLVGTPEDHGGVGSATVFVLKEDVWVNQHTMYAPTSGGGMELGDAQFGASVALSSAGNMALVGGPGDDPIGFEHVNAGYGAAWVFVHRGAVWIDQHKLTAPVSGPDAQVGPASFGSSVAISAGGATALVAGPNDDAAPPIQNGDSAGSWLGAAWVFVHRGIHWTVQGKLTAPTSGPDREIERPVDGGFAFATSVALAAGGEGALIGGWGDDGAIGAAWEFDYQGPFLSAPGHWAELQKLTAPTGGAGTEDGDGLFGHSVALAADANVALVGGPNAAFSNDIFGTTGPGAAWVFYAPEVIIK